MSAVDKIRRALQVVVPDLAISAGSIEQKIIDVIGTYADTEALERENTLQVIRTALAQQKTTGIEYYRRKAVEFQIDSTLEFDPVNFGARYAEADPAKQIVKQACIVGAFPNYALRVNKFDNAERRLVPLTQDELDSFDSYFAHFQPLGLNLDIQTREPAIITDPELVIYILAGYDATAIAAAINEAFVQAQQVLRTTNKVTTSELVDTIQSVQGVKAVGFSSALQATDTNLSGESVTIVPDAGLFNLYTNAFIFDTQITPSMVRVLQ